MMFPPHPRPSELIQKVKDMEQRLADTDEKLKQLIAGQSVGGKPLAIQFDELINQSKRFYQMLEEPKAQLREFQIFSETAQVTEETLEAWVRVMDARAHLFDLLRDMMEIELDARRAWLRAQERVEMLTEKARNNRAPGAKEIEQIGKGIIATYNSRIRQRLREFPLDQDSFWDYFRMSQP